MKQIRKIVFLIIMLFAFSLNINAKTVCEYGDKLTITFANNEAKIDEKYYSNELKGIIGEFYDKFILTNMKRKDPSLSKDLVIIEGSCPSKVAYCKYEKVHVGYQPINDLIEKYEAIKYAESLDDVFSQSFDLVEHRREFYVGVSEKTLNELDDDLKATKNGVKEEGILGWQEAKDIFSKSDLTFTERLGIIAKSLGTNIYSSTYKECGEIEYTGELPTYDLACPKVTNFIKDYSVAGVNYKNAKGNDKLDKLAIVKEKETQIREYCKTILQNYDYDGLEGECIDSCLKIEERIKEHKKANGLLHDASTECGFSKRLLSFVANVMKWVKFILPVIVIVLGILDFIKAIGAEKDDDIKKAQKKFIYRLIAAALIFIVPFILEFVLDKLGFSDYTSGCGVITEIE